MNLMNGREVCVCYFVEILRQGQPKISRHLAYLRRAGLVAARREGKWMHYRIAPQGNSAASSILATVLESLRDDRQMQSDGAKLERACCTPRGLVTLEGAPRPAEIGPAAGPAAVAQR